MNRTGTGFAVAFLGTVLLANWLTSTYGFVAVGFGLTATAGTYAAGLALALRDAVQDTLGRLAVLTLVLAGAALSALLANPTIALASGIAFALSELADFAIYTPLRRRAQLGDGRWATAVIASNLVGAIIDTVVFVGIAFGLAIVGPALPGQLLGKTWATLAYLAIGAVIARALLRHPVRPERDQRDESRPPRAHPDPPRP